MSLHPFTGIYPILDARWLNSLPPEIKSELSPERIARHLGRIAISMVQLRCKSDGRESFAFMSAWMEVLRRYCPDVKVILNDRLELALALGADGVHVGQDDVPVSVCRRLLGPDRIIGLSTHSLAEVRDAESQQVDYIGFGPIFSTLTKHDTQTVQGVEGLAAIVEKSCLPVVAIGGITLESVPAVAQSGTAAVAMISDLWRKDWDRRLTEANALFTVHHADQTRGFAPGPHQGDNPPGPLTIDNY
ncbi:MAG: thiamine phosphate synthase [Magnetococcales bacterium]|nr:thiamine phosphate synthase [Magnetococcales bacterium]MBF0439510.1 thiamine phosphate synthase [Magnetococcales bacterium]